jgi:PKD repeat protein
VWIDINDDGDFEDEGEEVFAADNKKGTVSGSIAIPGGLTGETWMRVSMKYAAAPAPCEQIPYGEVEEYLLTFIPPEPQPPVADFSGDPTSLYEGETVQFTDLSSNNPTSWSWSFPGGTPSTSTIQNPLITYNTAGTYSVTLTATNGDGSDTHTETDFITVSVYVPQPPVADFSGSPTTLFEGETVQFTDLSSNDPTEWFWSFPEGTPSTSTAQNPVITYNSEGVYSVTLTATNMHGTDIHTKTDYITVNQQGSVTYCESSSQSNAQEWIAQVDIDGFLNSSGASIYSDFTSLTVDLSPGSSSNVVLTPGYSGRSQREFWRIWIDFNGDGDFEDAGEQVFVANNKKDAVSGTMSIPSAATGQTRMRISMKNGSSPGPCETFLGGEVEDYTANFTTFKQGGISRTYNGGLVIFPNPNNGTFQVKIEKEIHPEAQLKVYDLKGVLLCDLHVSHSLLKLDLSRLSTGIYHISLINGNDYSYSKLVKR